MKINLQCTKKARVFTKLALADKKQNLFQGISLIVISCILNISVYHSILSHDIYKVSDVDKINLGLAFLLLTIGVSLILKNVTSK